MAGSPDARASGDGVRPHITAFHEEAMLSAAKKTFGHEKNIEAKFNPELGEVELFEIKTVVDNVEDPENQVTLAAADVLPR